MNNRMHNATNPNQGNFETVLCVCSAGLLRSPSLAYYLANQGYNTRAVGAHAEYALLPIDEVLIYWADTVVFVNKETYNYVLSCYNLSDVNVIVLDIPDRYQYRDPKLMEIIEQQWNKNKGSKKDE